MDYPPDRVAAITGVPAESIVALARRYGTTKPALLKFTDGIQRHGNGGQTCRALACLPAVVGQIGVRGGGLYLLDLRLREVGRRGGQSPLRVPA